MSKDFRLYKPLKNGDGAVSSWQLSRKKNQYGEYFVAFLEVASQLPNKDENGNDRFDWDNKIIVKLEIVDIAEILSVLRGLKDQVGSKGSLFHESNNGNKMISFNYNTNNSSYYLRVSHKKPNGDLQAVQHSISPAEGIILGELLKRAVVKVHGW